MKKQLLIFSKTILGIFIILSLVYVSQAYSQNPLPRQLSDIKQPSWNHLATKKIFFAHQSVGSNMMKGVEEIVEENKHINLNIVRIKKGEEHPSSPSFFHGSVGRNMEPESKIESFRDQIENYYGGKIDIAFFKFCYIDFNPETDIESVFQKYKKTMDALSIKYPDTTFVHVTAPLTCYAPGLRGLKKRAKNLIKKIMGKVDNYDHSSANLFNQLLIKEYQGKAPIFDLAGFESTTPDGTRILKKKEGNQYYELVQEYTKDGGHLNEKGRRIIAEQLLLFLAELSAEQK